MTGSLPPAPRRLFVVRRVSTQMTKSGKNYLNLVLADRHGEMPGRKWEVDEKDRGLKTGMVISTRGNDDPWNGKPQWKIKDWREARPDEREEADLVPRVEGDHDARWERMKRAAAAISDTALKGLAETLLEEHGEAIRRATAAKRMHSAGRGGLMEHIVSLLEMAERLGDTLAGVDRDLLVAGILLHDIGKIREMTLEPAIDYTVEGRLLGHILIGCGIIEETAKRLGIPRERILPLLHLVASHHGTRAFGSPVEPMTAEAVALHQLDNLDAKLNALAGEEGEGIQWHPNLRQHVYRAPNEGGIPQTLAPGTLPPATPATPATPEAASEDDSSLFTQAPKESR